LALCQELVRRHHYSQGGSNTATFRHGLFPKDNPLLCKGAAWWIPPTKGAAQATWAGDWRKVLALSRLVVAPDVPSGGATFLLGRSVRLIKRAGGWECLVTYADEWQGHTGAIYRATNWLPQGRTEPQPVWVDGRGRMQARKRGPVTLTHDEMAARGYRLLGYFAKQKFIYPLVDAHPAGWGSEVAA
jgi:hypothetical protein